MDEDRVREAWEKLVERGEYSRAIKSLDSRIKKEPRDERLYRLRAQLHLSMGQTQQARADFDMTTRLHRETDCVSFGIRSGRLYTDIEYNAIGVTYWMEEYRELALDFWRFTTGELLANRVAYTHGGGGIEAGLLLWFGAVLERKEEDIALVRRFYEARLASSYFAPRLTTWPGPIARFFLEQIDENQLIESASTGGDCRCEAYFALAIRALEQKRHVAAKKRLKEAASGADFNRRFNVWPYYLARYETGGIPAGE